MNWRKFLVSTATASLLVMLFANSASAFPIADYAWSDEKWAEVSEEVRTSYNPDGPLNSEELTITVNDERFIDFIYWVWHNKIDEHQVEMIGGSEWDGPEDGVIFHWAPGSRWETHTVMPFDMAIGHVTGEHQWFDTQFPEFFEQHGGTEGVNIKSRLSVDESPTWFEFVDFIGDPEGDYYRYLYHQEVGIDPDKKLIYMMGGNGAMFTYTFQRYLDELKEVLTDAKAYQFFEMYDELGKGFASELGWANNPVPKDADVAMTANASSNIVKAHMPEYMENEKTHYDYVSASSGKGKFDGHPIVNVSVNGSELKTATPSVNIDGTTYTALRDLSSALQFQLAWDKDSQTAYVAKDVPEKIEEGGILSTFKGYNTVHLVAGGNLITDKPSIVLKNTIYVPLRSFSNAFDLPIRWSSESTVRFVDAVKKVLKDWTGDTVPLDSYTGEVREFDLEIHTIEQQIAPGIVEEMWGYGLKGEEATVPGPTLRVQKGDLVKINFHNTHDNPHTIHPHGMNSVNTWNDGVPHLSKMVMPGETFTYEFVANEAGTFGYHCHVDTKVHLQMGMIGAIVVEDPEEQKMIDRDYTLILSEWEEGRNPNDIEHDPEYDYFLVNGKQAPEIPALKVEEDEIARVRLINFGSLVHSLHLHGHSFLVVQKDGRQLPEPYYADTLMIGPGERYDVLLKGRDGKFIWHDHNTNQEGMLFEVHGSPEERHEH